jgi:hypothetical protein
MKNLTKPVLAAATIAVLASGILVAQGGVANAATTSDCAVAVSLKSDPIVTTAADTKVDVTTTWTGLCAFESKDATATYGFASTTTSDATATATPILAAYPVKSRSLGLGTGTDTITVPSSGLPAAGGYVQLQLLSTTAKTAATPTPTATPTPDPTATADPGAEVVTEVSAKSNLEQVKASGLADIKYTRTGKTVNVLGHAYTFNGTTKVAQSEQSVQLQKKVGTAFQTVATTTTSTTGRYEFNISDAAASTYRVSTTDTTTAVASTSPELTAAIFKIADTKVIRLSTSKTAKKATITGTLFVRSATTGNFKATSGVAANLEKKVNGSWVKVKKVRSTSSGTITAVANNVKKTAYRFVVIQNSSYKKSTSASITR